MNSFTDCFQQYFNPKTSPLMYLFKPPPPAPMFSTLVRNPRISAHWGDGKFCWYWNFYAVVGIWGGVILTIQTFFKTRKQHIVKFPQWRLKWNFAERRIFFTRWWKFEVRSQVIEYNRIFSFQKFCTKWSRGFYQTCFCFLKKLYMY